MIPKGLHAAIGLLTTIPTRGETDARLGLPYFSVIGSLLGGVMAASVWAMGHKLGWHLGAAVLAVGLMTLLTGALHLDGLADSADACGVQCLEEKLRVMKDPHVGTFGVVAIGLALLFKVASLQALSSQGLWLWALLPCTLSRAAQVIALLALPNLRAAGKARLFSDSVKPWHALVATLWAVGMTVAILRWDTLVLIPATALVLGLILHRIFKIFGGVTGDLVGAVSEMTEAWVWGCLAVMALSAEA